MVAISCWDRPASYASTINFRYRTCAAYRSTAAFCSATRPDDTDRRWGRWLGPIVDGRRLRFLLFATPPL